MNKKPKMWSLLVHLSMHMWGKRYDTLPFDDDFWNYILKESVKSGINTVVLDIGDGIQFATHPEISMNGAWSRKRVRAEIRKCRDMGITLIPKLNFATPHDMWLGEYARMVSTNTYYKVANDLIKEVYDLFEKPEYIHLGMDEEDARHVAGSQYAVFRQGELYWHDVNLLLDCVADTGAKPWIWSCPLFRHVEEYQTHVDVDDAIISPWYYNALREDHWTPIDSRQDYIDYYTKGVYKDLHLKYVEEDPFCVNFRKVALPLLEKGYKYVPCASLYNWCWHNTEDLVEYFHDNASDDQILGYMTAPWCSTQGTEYNKSLYDASFKCLKEAKEKYYG